MDVVAIAPWHRMLQGSGSGQDVTSTLQYHDYHVELGVQHFLGSEVHVESSVEPLQPTVKVN